MGNSSVCAKCSVCDGVSTVHPLQQISVLVTGLDGAGKTTIVKALNGERVLEPVRTIGLQVTRLPHERGRAVLVLDVGGGRHIRAIWRQYAADCHALVFVLDAADTARVPECRAALHGLLDDQPLLHDKPLLVLANKQDTGACLDEAEVAEQLMLAPLANKHRCVTHVHLCSALLATASSHADRDPGLRHAFSWLLDHVTSNFAALDARVQVDMTEQRAEQERAREERRLRISLRQQCEDTACSEVQNNADPVDSTLPTDNLPQMSQLEEDVGKSRNENSCPLSCKPRRSASAVVAPVEYFASSPSWSTDGSTSDGQKRQSAEYVAGVRARYTSAPPLHLSSPINHAGRIAEEASRVPADDLTDDVRRAASPPMTTGDGDVVSAAVGEGLSGVTVIHPLDNGSVCGVDTPAEIEQLHQVNDVAGMAGRRVVSSSSPPLNESPLSSPVQHRYINWNQHRQNADIDAILDDQDRGEHSDQWAVKLDNDRHLPLTCDLVTRRSSQVTVSGHDDTSGDLNDLVFVGDPPVTCVDLTSDMSRPVDVTHHTGSDDSSLDPRQMLVSPVTTTVTADSGHLSASESVASASSTSHQFSTTAELAGGKTAFFKRLSSVASQMSSSVAPLP